MRKKLMITVVLIVITVIITGCTNLNSAPYDPQQITALLEEKYGVKGRFDFIEEISQTNKQTNETQYLFYDNERELEFVAYSFISSNFWGNFGYHRSWDDGLNQGIMFAKKEQATALAQSYGMDYRPVDSISGRGLSIDKVYINDQSQLDLATGLFFELFEIYDLEKPGKSTSIHFYRLDETDKEGENSKNKTVLLVVSYASLTPEGNLEEGSTVTFTKDQVLEMLLESWEKTQSLY